VLHDMFDVPFDDIAPIVGRSCPAVRQLASRARRRVKGAAPAPESADPDRRRRVVQAYLTATRAGDFDALVALLDPDVVLRADAAAGPTPAPLVIRGARVVAKGALASAERARSTETAFVNGAVGLVMAPHGRQYVVLTFTIVDGRITEIDVIAEPDRVRRLELAPLGD
jgi:RNA polymerase sigma-70 factor (ECF subfamily)